MNETPLCRFLFPPRCLDSPFFWAHVRYSFLFFFFFLPLTITLDTPAKQSFFLIFFSILHNSMIIAVFFHSHHFLPSSPAFFLRCHHLQSSSAVLNPFMSEFFILTVRLATFQRHCCSMNLLSTFLSGCTLVGTFPWSAFFSSLPPGSSA